MMINILNAEQIKNIFSKLNPDAKPLFGKMSPQHVIEHLTKVLKISSGKIGVKLYFSPLETEVLKQKIIYSDIELPMGIKNPTMSDELAPLNHVNIREALNELYHEINYFEKKYIQNPNSKTIHPRMGELNYSEWLRFHNKHFLHHFKQYDLV